ncbi:MAG TPA: polysaccharide pyruvyl transferase family protein [Streptosporangiaceae bacterium]|nr:polysaccharide pyruvyl transferase family protein [Streptosporangiaceae bacterium]
MTSPGVTGPRVGLFGLLGSGNVGNDASLEAVLAYLRADHPDAVIDAMCMGPGRVRSQYGIEAIPLQWYKAREDRHSGWAAAVLKATGKGLDAWRTLAWVRRHDAVIVPGMGVLESSLPLKASGFPYAMFLLGVSGKVSRTKVALVSVGATMIKQRLIRQFFDIAARTACYRSYRDDQSRENMRRRGLDVSGDPVYPDLVFSLPVPDCGPGDPQIVGLGVMAYHGTNDHRSQAADIHAAYLADMKRFARWLVDRGSKIRLTVGDGPDNAIAHEIVADLRAYRPDLEPSWAVAEPVASFADLTGAMAPVGLVVATRYHNVICALRLGKPVISLGYSAKNQAVMAGMGLAEFCQVAHTLDVDQLTEQFTALEQQSAQLRETIIAGNAASATRLREQFTALSALLFPGSGPARRPARGQVRQHSRA